MIAWILARLGVVYDELDVAGDPRWRAQVVVLSNAERAYRQADHLIETAFVLLERCAVQAVQPKRKVKSGGQVLRCLPSGECRDAEGPRLRARKARA